MYFRYVTRQKVHLMRPMDSTEHALCSIDLRWFAQPVRDSKYTVLWCVQVSWKRSTEHVPRSIEHVPWCGQHGTTGIMIISARSTLHGTSSKAQSSCLYAFKRLSDVYVFNRLTFMFSTDFRGRAFTFWVTFLRK